MSSPRASSAMSSVSCRESGSARCIGPFRSSASREGAPPNDSCSVPGGHAGRARQVGLKTDQAFVSRLIFIQPERQNVQDYLALFFLLRKCRDQQGYSLSIRKEFGKTWKMVQITNNQDPCHCVNFGGAPRETQIHVTKFQCPSSKTNAPPAHKLNEKNIK